MPGPPVQFKDLANLLPTSQALASLRGLFAIPKHLRILGQSQHTAGKAGSSGQFRGVLNVSLRALWSSAGATLKGSQLWSKNVHPSLKREDRLQKHQFAGFGTVMEGIKRSAYMPKTSQFYWHLFEKTRVLCFYIIK